MPALWLGTAIAQPCISSNFVPSAALKVMCAPGVEPLKNFAMSSCVGSEGLPGLLAATVTESRSEPISISLLILVVAPTFSSRRGGNAIAGRSHCRLLEQAESDPDDVRRVGFDNDRAAAAIQHQTRLLRPRSSSKGKHQTYAAENPLNRHSHHAALNSNLLASACGIVDRRRRWLAPFCHCIGIKFQLAQ